MDTIQHQIEILEDAILLAKHGIPSSRILSIKDFTKIKIFRLQQNITVTVNKSYSPSRYEYYSCDLYAQNSTIIR